VERKQRARRKSFTDRPLFLARSRSRTAIAKTVAKPPSGSKWIGWTTERATPERSATTSRCGP
jgi:hypothetical protein